MAYPSVAVIAVVALLALQASGTSAAKKTGSGGPCSNVEFVLKSLENCVDNPVVRVDKFNVTLTPSCDLVPTGCINRTAYTSAKVTYDIKKDAIQMKGDVDVCNAVENLSPTSKALIEPIKVFATCPATAASMCGDQNAKASITSALKYLQFAQGTITGTVSVKHDTGASCVKFEAVLNIKKKSKTLSKLMKKIG